VASTPPATGLPDVQNMVLKKKKPVYPNKILALYRAMQVYEPQISAIFLQFQPKERFHHHIFATNLMTNSLTKSPNIHMSHIFIMFVSQKFVANQVSLSQIHKGKFVIKFVAKM
jgi:hypothetical protein